ncbi:MAG TPA: hypothetical protein VH087_21310, partial [Thermoanaerobaculia bacterium]|nr:hypothetical protein [Thermoanaerobaculia bacterium]
MKSEIAIIEIARRLVRFETQMRRSASRKNQVKVLDGVSAGGRLTDAKQRFAARRAFDCRDLLLDDP